MLAAANKKKQVFRQGKAMKPDSWNQGWAKGHKTALDGGHQAASRTKDYFQDRIDAFFNCSEGQKDLIEFMVKCHPKGQEVIDRCLFRNRGLTWEPGMPRHYKAARTFMKGVFFFSCLFHRNSSSETLPVIPIQVDWEEDVDVERQITRIRPVRCPYKRLEDIVQRWFLSKHLMAAARDYEFPRM